MPILTVAGSIADPNFHEARLIAEDVVSHDSLLRLHIVGLVPSEWEAYLENLRKHPTLISTAFAHPVDQPFVSHNNEGYIGSTPELISWSKRKYGMSDPRNEKKTYGALQSRFATVAERKLVAYMRSNSAKNTYVYMDFLLPDATEKQRVIFELYSHACPKAVENIRQLCTGEAGQNGDGVILSYQNTLVHRVVPGGFIQFGDIATGRGNTNTTTTGTLLPDESFLYRHDGPGVLALANMGSRHTNGSQLYVTLREMPSLDERREVVGRVLLGMDVIEAIAEVRAANERPVSPVTIVACGHYSASELKADEEDEEDEGVAALRVVKHKPSRQDHAARVGSLTLAVLGLDGAGKTSVVNALKREHDPQVTPTNGFEVETLWLRQWEVRALGLGGNNKIRGIWPHYFADAHGLLFVVDAQDRARLLEAAAEFRKMVAHAEVVGKPVLVLLNKYDGAHDPRTDIDAYLEPCEVERAFGIAADETHSTLVRVCSVKPARVGGALHPQDQAVLDAAVSELCSACSAMGTLQARVDRDVALREEEVRKLKEERRRAREAEQQQ